MVVNCLFWFRLFVAAGYAACGFCCVVVCVLLLLCFGCWVAWFGLGGCFGAWVWCYLWFWFSWCKLLSLILIVV